MVHIYEKLLWTRVMRIFTDASWAGDRKSRKSISGGCAMLGSHWTKLWSMIRFLIALSPAESELYVSIKIIGETIGA